ALPLSLDSHTRRQSCLTTTQCFARVSSLSLPCRDTARLGGAAILAALPTTQARCLHHHQASFNREPLYSSARFASFTFSVAQPLPPSAKYNTFWFGYILVQFSLRFKPVHFFT